MSAKTVEVTANGVTAHLTLRHPTAGDVLRRENYATRALEAPLPDETDQTLAIVFYPRCMGCLAEGNVDGKPARDLTTAEFVALPAEIFESWWAAAQEVAPAWDLRPRLAEGAAPKNS